MARQCAAMMRRVMSDRPIIAADSDAARANAQVVLDFFEVVLGFEHNTDQIGRFVSPGFIDHDPAGADSGMGGVAAKLDGLWSALPEGRYIPETVVSAGELVVVRSRLVTRSSDSAVTRGATFADTYRVVDGFIAEHWHVVDNAALASLLASVT